MTMGIEIETDRQGAPLARQPQAMRVFQPVEWTRERVELMKRTITPRQISDDDFALFLEMCRATGLNPFLKQAYCVERRAKVGNEWVSRWEFTAAESGMAARADQQADFLGIRGAAVYSGDFIEIDEAAGTVEHKYNPAKREGKLIGAWAQARREGRQVPVTYLRLESRIQTRNDGQVTQFWARMPDGMILKCARAEQFRLAYPNLFSGVYIEEELEANQEETSNASPAAPARPRVETVEAKVTSRKAQLPAVRTVKFGGEAAGKAIGSLSDEQLQKLIAVGKERVTKEPKAAWAANVLANITEIEDELQFRASVREKERKASEMATAGVVTVDAVTREPGSDDGDEGPPPPF